MENSEFQDAIGTTKTVRKILWVGVILTLAVTTPLIFGGLLPSKVAPIYASFVGLVSLLFIFCIFYFRKEERRLIKEGEEAFLKRMEELKNNVRQGITLLDAFAMLGVFATIVSGILFSVGWTASISRGESLEKAVVYHHEITGVAMAGKEVGFNTGLEVSRAARFDGDDMKGIRGTAYCVEDNLGNVSIWKETETNNAKGLKLIEIHKDFQGSVEAYCDRVFEKAA